MSESREAARFRELAASLGELDPLLLGWAARRPLKLLELDSDALTAARVALWLRDNPAPGIYVRQLGLPGVHTKFIERHRQVIDQLLAAVAAGSDLDEVEADAEPPMDSALKGPARRLPWTTVPAVLQRRGSPAGTGSCIRLSSYASASWILNTCAGRRPGHHGHGRGFSTLQLPVHTVIATENQVNFLALPERPGTLALYGAGYGFSSLRDAAWLRDCEILYWGDIDTHGFRILDQLRAVHPHVESVLMDEETLLAHRNAWGTEPLPSRAPLTRLTAEIGTLRSAG